MNRDSSMPGGGSSSPLSDLAGTVVDGRYEVGRLLGCGGMGAVYEAMQLRLDRRVAIKILNPVYMHRDDYVARFLREAKAASAIRHENVVQVIDFGELPNGSVYSVMEFLEGYDLAELLRERGRLPWAETRGLLLQMARGLKAAHAEGVIHRDIKPANLFLVPYPEEERVVLKILDFGIARVQTAGQHTAGLTGTADLLGTPMYMAPELARGKPANPRSEVYSVGVVAYRMLTGDVPFNGDTPFDILFRASTEPAPPLRDHDPSLPSAVESLVLRMLAKDPLDRFHDMASLYRSVLAIDEHGQLARDVPVPTGPMPTLATAAAGESSPGAPTVNEAAPVEAAPVEPVAAEAAAEPVASPPEVVIPPPLSVSPQTRAVIAATRAARGTEATSPGDDAPPADAVPATDAMAPADPMPTDPATESRPVVVPLPAGDSEGSGDEGSELDDVLGTRRRQTWIVAGIGGVVSIGLLAVLFDGDTDDREPAAPVPTVATRSPTADGVAASGAPTPAADAPAAPPNRGAPSDAAAAPRDAAAAPSDAAAAPRDAAAAPSDAEPATDAAPAAAGPDPTASPPTAEPRPRPRNSATPSRSKPASPPAASPSKPATKPPPTDAEVERRIARRARKKCRDALGGAEVRVTFVIGANGETLTPRADRSDAGARCVAQVVDAATFSPGTLRKGAISL